MKRLLRPVVSAARARLHRGRVWAECVAADFAERGERTAYDWPPAMMRYRVHGAADLASYQRVGRQCADDVLAALAAAQVDANALKSVLDFGAGCGRTIRYLSPKLPGAKFTACDIDRAAIEWARAHTPTVTWQQTGELPPLPFADGAFDFIYAISVFTHLDERRQPAWLEELRRVTRPGGHVLLTVHGGAAAGLQSQGNANWKGLFPGWYQDVIHSEEYVRREFGREMSIVAYRPKGMNAHQDVVLLQRPA